MATIGTIILLPTKVIPKDYLPCDGRELSIANYSVLFAVLGKTFGGDGKNTFALPKLDNKFGCRHLICIDGDFSPGVKYTLDFDDLSYIGTIVPFEGNTIPYGWALCDGTTHPATDNQALAHILGTHVVAEKAGEFYDMPKTGSERYIICTLGAYPR